MKTIVKLYSHKGEELTKHNKIYEQMPYHQEVLGYIKAIESISEDRVAYYQTDVIYINK